MPIHCHTCTCTKVVEGRQYGPDSKIIKLKVKGWKFEIGINHPLYRLRYSIMSRCYNAKSSDYPYYQGKGIKVFEEWRTNPISFYTWCLENGWKSGLSLDRIDPNSDYEPSNCQFITLADNLKKCRIQNPKIRNSKLSEDQVREIRKMLAQDIKIIRIAKEFGVSSATIGAIKSGQNWSSLKG